MLKRSENGIEWLEFDHFPKEKMVHRIFLKNENLDFASNLALPKILPSLGLEAVFKGKLSHSSTVIEIESSQFHPEGFFDGMVTNKTRLGLLVTHADCQSAVFYDPVNHALATVHCGWRGNVQSIYSNAIGAMRRCYGSAPENLLVGISPSLGPNHSEFINYLVEFPDSFRKHETNKNYFNLWDIAEEELRNCGILSHHLKIARLCTYANSTDFYSYRRDKGSARNGTLAFLT